VQVLTWNGDALVLESEEWYVTGEPPYVFINGIPMEPLVFDAPPIIESGLTLVPFRAIFEALGATVLWNESEQKVTGQLGDRAIEMIIDDNTAYVNGQPITLDAPPKIINDRTLVPLRFISENFGFKVDWHEEMQRIDITTVKGDTL
jgi:hypothetical protein